MYEVETSESTMAATGGRRYWLCFLLHLLHNVGISLSGGFATGRFFNLGYWARGKNEFVQFSEPIELLLPWARKTCLSSNIDALDPAQHLDKIIVPWFQCLRLYILPK